MVVEQIRTVHVNIYQSNTYQKYDNISAVSHWPQFNSESRAQEWQEVKSITSISIAYPTIYNNPLSTRRCTTSINKRLLKLLNQHFPRSNKLHRMFTRNTVKAILHTATCII